MPNVSRNRMDTPRARVVAPAVMLACALAVGSCAPAGAPDTGSDSAATAALRARYVAAFNAGDTAGVLALYAEHATLVSDGGTFAGHAGIARWLQAGLAEGSRLEPIAVEAHGRSGTLAYETGRTRRHVGAALHHGQYLIVLERVGEEWKIVRHFSITSR